MTTDEERAIAREAIARLDVFGGLDPAAAKIERMASLTNLGFRVAAPDGRRWFLRVPGKGTEEYIDRRVEEVNARAAAAAGVSARVLHFGDDGVMVADFIDGCTTMTPETLRTTPGAPARAARAFRKLHTSGESFAVTFDLFEQIDGYLAHLDKLGVTDFPEGYDETVKEAQRWRAALDAHPATFVPCHCDPLCENFLDDGSRMWIVDWEYSGMNDPMWDLGDLSVEAGFGPAEEREMMEAWFDGPAPADQWGRMVIYKASCDLLWTLWGLIQLATGNPVDDFQAYADTRFARCRALMAEPGFEDHVAAAAKG